MMLSSMGKLISPVTATLVVNTCYRWLPGRAVGMHPNDGFWQVVELRDL